MVDADAAGRREAETLLLGAIEILDRNPPSDRAAALAATYVSLAIEHLNPAGYSASLESGDQPDEAIPGSSRASTG